MPIDDPWAFEGVKHLHGGPRSGLQPRHTALGIAGQEVVMGEGERSVSEKLELVKEP